MTPYNPNDWYWQVADRTDYWSSAATAYVETLPEGAGLTHIASEIELSEVLAPYGLKGPAVIVPERVTANQFGKQLAVAGLMDQVQAWVAQQDAATQWSFNRSATFVRADPMMQIGFAALGFTVAQIDAFFTAAAEL
jgi:hypothetical protein